MPFVLDAMRELDTFVQSRAEEAARRCCSPSAARAIGRCFPRTVTRPGSGSAPSAAAIAACWRQDRQLQGPYQRRRYPAGVHLPGAGRLHSRCRRDRRLPGAGGRREGRRQAHDERVHGRLRQAAEPAQPGRITGGSSSGSGAALAAGEVDVSFGGDQGGSIRLPAAFCGVVGLKPTFGLVSHFAVGFAAEPSVDHVGPMARTVPDVAAALQAVAAYDDNDPRSAAASRTASTRCPAWTAA